MKIKIQDGCKTVNGKAVKIGEVVETDANTARNLIKKRFATAADAEAERLNLEVNSVQTPLAAQANITRTLLLRKQYADQQKEQARLMAA